LADQFVKHFFAPRQQPELRSPPCEFMSERLADAGRCTRDENYFVSPKAQSLYVP
jgi:hypothetical protein